MKRKSCPTGWRARPGPSNRIPVKTRKTDRHPFSRWLATVLLCLLLAPVAEAIEHREFFLDNGLRVILVREAKAPVVVNQVWYRVGSTDEVAGKTGLAHMLEHMMFQGTKTLKPKEFSRIIARNGGSDNAFTSLDYTAYHTKLAADRLELALRLEADRMRNLVLTNEEFESENLVVREERRTRTDSNPDSRFMEEYRQLLFAEHPYGRPIIGWMEDIKNHTLDDLRAWYNRYYTPSNAILVVVGDVNFEQTREWVQRYFGPLPAQPCKKREKLPRRPPLKKNHRLEKTDDGAKLTSWMASYLTPSIRTRSPEVDTWETPEITTQETNDLFTLKVLAKILGGGSSSRLYRRLVVEKELAVSASAGFGGFSRGPAIFSLSAIPRKEVSIDTLEKAIFHEVALMSAEPVSERELERAKNSLIAGHVYGQDSIEHISYTIGQMAVSNANWRILIDEFPARVRAVSAERLQKMANRYLRDNHVLVGVLRP